MMILTRFSSTAPRQPHSHQRSPTSNTVPTTAPCRLLRVAPPSDVRPPRGASLVASPGQAWLQIFDLALIPIVGFAHRIESHRNITNTRGQNLIAKGSYCARSFSSLFLNFSWYNSRNTSRVYIHVRATDSAKLCLLVLNLNARIILVQHQLELHAIS